MPPKHAKIARNGFEYQSGKFYANPDRVEFIDGERLKKLFVPHISYEGQKLLNRSGFSEFEGNGVKLLQKALAEGKCDAVPARLVALREAMQSEWLAQMTPEELAKNPKWAIAKYFVDGAGQPDRAKAKNVVRFKLPRYGSATDKLCKALGKVPGLHYAEADGEKSDVVYAGWDEKAVDAAAQKHLDNEKAAEEAQRAARAKEREDRHAQYLAANQTNRLASIVGEYIIDCKEIADGWPEDADDMRLSIKKTRTSGLYEAYFHFGAAEGMMMLSRDETLLEPYADPEESDSEEEDEEDDGVIEILDTDEEEDDDDEPVIVGSKRKSTTNASNGPRSKSARTDPAAASGDKYFLVCRHRETGEGELYDDGTTGSITFDGSGFATFSGVVGINFIGPAVDFKGRKISNAPPKYKAKWTRYTYEAARQEEIERDYWQHQRLLEFLGDDAEEVLGPDYETFYAY